MRKTEKKNKKFHVSVRFEFDGCFIVNATSEEEAKNIVSSGYGMNCGELHANDSRVIDWRFNMQPNKTVK